VWHTHTNASCVDCASAKKSRRQMSLASRQLRPFSLPSHTHTRRVRITNRRQSLKRLGPAETLVEHIHLYFNKTISTHQKCFSCVCVLVCVQCAWVKIKNASNANWIRIIKKGSRRFTSMQSQVNPVWAGKNRTLSIIVRFCWFVCFGSFIFREIIPSKDSEPWPSACCGWVRCWRCAVGPFGRLMD
jgi:hypothetical protein